MASESPRTNSSWLVSILASAEEREKQKAKPAAAAAGGQAKCKDGKTVTYKNRQGTCSGHGGVASWL